ncbi:hypothetical protein D4U56_22735 [Shigella sonnei]|nr:hypothetical protein [Shigella sonnei]EFY0276250.1 hypothetical protein [Shigella sonnei]EGD9023406.1 hypothetical protein [Shigella sonnei]EGD9266994.1 hypothetical protein [Shigella sonnei]EGE0549472.1 hypothetical protein [Shigella sonnei]
MKVTDSVTTMQHQYDGESLVVVFVLCFIGSFLHQASFITGYWCNARHHSVRLVICDVWQFI